MGIGPVELLVITALCVAALFVITVLVTRWIANRIRSSVSDAIYGLDLGGRSALEILDKRYAHGEIGREEF